jgi:hypothetical protein
LAEAGDCKRLLERVGGSLIAQQQHMVVQQRSLLRPFR